MLKISENSGTEENGLVTPTPVLCYRYLNAFLAEIYHVTLVSPLINAWGVFTLMSKDTHQTAISELKFHFFFNRWEFKIENMHVINSFVTKG